jgi:hypothetical protein
MQNLLVTRDNSKPGCQVTGDNLTVSNNFFSNYAAAMCAALGQYATDKSKCAEMQGNAPGTEKNYLDNCTIRKTFRMGDTITIPSKLLTDENGNLLPSI